jgi:hypothetical protein
MITPHMSSDIPKSPNGASSCGTPPACDPEIFTQVQSSVEACNKLLDEECKRIRLLLALPPTKAQGNKKPEKTRRLDCGQSLRRRQTP